MYDMYFSFPNGQVVTTPVSNGYGNQQFVETDDEIIFTLAVPTRPPQQQQPQSSTRNIVMIKVFLLFVF